MALGAGLAPSAVTLSAAAAAPGLVLPRRKVPDLALLDADGRASVLSARLRGRVTAVQLMFAGCSTVCPIQGGIFAEVAGQLREPDVQLLSLTIDPLGDDPQALRRWLDRFGSPPRWMAAAPRVQDVDALTEFLRGAPGQPGSHPTQVFLVDRDARLAFRTVALPTAGHVATLLGQLAAS